LARQEALVRPGHVLGTARTAERNLLRSYAEYQHVGAGQQDMNGIEQNLLDQQYNARVQQTIEQEKKAAQMHIRVSALNLFEVI
jgi:hypothetical protein